MTEMQCNIQWHLSLSLDMGNISKSKLYDRVWNVRWGMMRNAWPCLRIEDVLDWGVLNMLKLELYNRGWLKSIKETVFKWSIGIIRQLSQFSLDLVLVILVAVREYDPFFVKMKLCLQSLLSLSFLKPACWRQHPHHTREEKLIWNFVQANKANLMKEFWVCQINY